MQALPFLDIPPLQHAHGTVQLPGSKSITNRMLLLAGLCQGSTTLHGVLDSQDTQVMLAALEKLGCTIQRKDNSDTVHITGFGGVLTDATRGTPEQPIELFLANAGTAMRPLAATLALLDGHFMLTGVPRMYERPIADLVDAVTQLGAQVNYAGTQKYPPLKIAPRQCNTAATDTAHMRVRGDVSSQFLTALLMAAPLAPHATSIEVEGVLISKPYIAITLEVMRQFGVIVQRDAHTGWQQFTIAADAHYTSPNTLQVEADASSASYFIALGAIAADAKAQHSITIKGVGKHSIQGDIQFVEAARSMGADITAADNHITITQGTFPLQAIDLDCNHIPDAAMTLAIMALYAQGTTTLRNIASWRVKETDRIAAMQAELMKLGAQVEAGEDYISITPPKTRNDWQAASIGTYDDHRMAMCFSLAAFNPAQQPVRIQDPACVIKTFPHYFDAFFSVVHTAAQHIPVICIDGPSASGKGTLSATLAQQLGYYWLDSGALYRIVGLAARRAGLLQNNNCADVESKIAKLVADLQVRFSSRGVWLQGENISEAIRTEQAGADASCVAALPLVRSALLQWQHNYRKLPGLVADGRDMGTVVFPDAPLKVFLTANANQRAQRRYKQLICQGVSVKMDDLCADLAQRDARDSQRTVAPLKPAQDALLLDNSQLDAPQSVQQVLQWWQGKQPFA